MLGTVLDMEGDAGEGYWRQREETEGAGRDTGNAGGDTGDGEGILEVEVRMQG